MSHYYNEHDPKAAAWLRALIDAGQIPAGDVDERDIREVQPDDVRDYTQAHFFAGIGGWPLALRLAGWPEHRCVWTGSCPCQPWSDAGDGGGESDPRHLWPAWFPLIRECGPPSVFGEQVASKAALRWLDGVFADLEGADYACGAADLCAAGVRAPHRRQRLCWVADADGRQPRNENVQPRRQHGQQQTNCRVINGLGNSRGEGLQERSEQEGRVAVGHEGTPAHAAGSVGAWSTGIFVKCSDGKARRIEPSIQPLAHGVPARVGRLRGYGNAIVPQVAAEFIAAFMDVAPPPSSPADAGRETA